MGPVGARIFSSVFILAGGAVLSFGLRNLQRAAQSSSWPTVEGRIVSSRVEARRGDKGRTTYGAEVHYQYVVDGRLHDSNDVAFGDYSSSDPAHARGIVNRYPTGTKAAVHYWPEDPAEAVLETGISSQTFFMPGAGAVFLLAGSAMFAFMPRAMARQQTAREASTGA